MATSLITKQCVKCGNNTNFKSLNGYSRAANRGVIECSRCQRIRYYNERMSRGVEQSYARNNNLKNNYGITVDDYNKMFTSQDGKCSICNKHQSELNIRLHVDHCHTTGAIRGLLCHGCNHGLGHFKDNVESLSNAISYLKRFNNVSNN